MWFGYLFEAVNVPEKSGLQHLGLHAQALGQALAASGATPAALTQYAQARWQRNARVQKRALRNAWIFHASGPTRWGRDVAMRALGERLLDLPWLYGVP